MLYHRFSDLAPATPQHPSVTDIESGMWYPATYAPDERSARVLSSHSDSTQQFAAIEPLITTYSNTDQTITAISSPHLTNPLHPFYAAMPNALATFKEQTEGLPRVVVREGQLRPQKDLLHSDEYLIREAGDMTFLQALATRACIEVTSSEPIDQQDMLAVQKHWPELAKDVRLYAQMRVLPQVYRIEQKQYSQEDLSEFRPVNYLGNRPARITDETIARIFEQDLREPADKYMQRYARLQHNALAGKEAAALYARSMSGRIGGISILHAAAAHLRKSHDIPVKHSDLVYEPSKDVADQIFSCTNSPVFLPKPETTADLCDVQKVAVLVNRLRDRRIITVLGEAAANGDSLFWMSGPLHYDMAQTALAGIAAERRLAPVHVQLPLDALGLVAQPTTQS